ncbi:uncharacterized protein VTP21DRAFT_6918 [Calcarisporiella thermophila]|uniref:uncharacterized protein n=1 Tax=Calcarisporiella thermophila TaxID=911321 RepID=UPI0037439145
MPRSAFIVYTPLRSCFVNLPPSWASALLDHGRNPHTIVLEISWIGEDAEKHRAYVGWSGAATAHSAFGNINQSGEIIEIDPQFGQSLGIRANEKVQVDFCKNVPDGSMVNVEPYSADDWEIIELHAGYLEENLLRQIRVVYAGQIATIWLHGKTLIRIRVAEVHPKSPCVLLNNDAEVVVAPKLRNLPSSIKPPEDDIVNSTTKPSSTLAPAAICLRALPMSTTTAEDDFFAIYVHPQTISRLPHSSLLHISHITPPSTSSQLQSQQQQQQQQQMQQSAKDDLEKQDTKLAKYLYVRPKPSSSVPLGHVHLNEWMRKLLEIEPFGFVRLAAPKSPTVISQLTLLPVQANTGPAAIKLGLNPNQAKQSKTNMLVELFKEWVRTVSAEMGDRQPLLLTNGMVVRLNPGGFNTNHNMDGLNEADKIILRLDPKEGSEKKQADSEEIYAALGKQQVLSLKIGVGEIVAKESEEVRAKWLEADREKLGGVDSLIDKYKHYLRCSLSRTAIRNALKTPGMGGLLLCGGHGSGKTSIAKVLGKELAQDTETLSYFLEINCSEITEDRVPTIREKLQQWFDDAAWHAPAILFFDDLDRLAPAEQEHVDSFRARQIAECFIQIATKMLRAHPKISLMATAQGQANVHPILVASHVFSEVVHLNPPTKNERKQVLDHIMRSGAEVLRESVSALDLLSVAGECEGFLAADLRALVERAVHEGAVRQLREKMEGSVGKDSKLLLKQEDFNRARDGFVPSSLRGVKLQSSSVSWTDIGGLRETKRVLLETLEWPTKYAPIFAKCPLRLRSGLLLYGFPGCGKTLLASAVAKECGLNFISVKGPELLNKYIGASEKSVRDLFERAQAAKPCVLFFDEFDSVATKRGHDSTGVTDRVVNQMLTQMDGAEGLEGVYVLAATSRPDLIDPALLRPGRLDKALLCGIPTEEDRYEILSCLASKMSLDKSIDLRNYSRRSEGFTGADLQAFLYNAYLEAIHDCVSAESLSRTRKLEGEEEEMAFTAFESIEGEGVKSQNITVAERGLISRRLGLIRKGLSRNHTDTTTTSNPIADLQKKTAVITEQHLEKSLAATRPSITPQEHQRLDAIYREFVSGRNGEMPTGEGVKEIGKRSTLM